jgi:hypothetical protein
MKSFDTLILDQAFNWHKPITNLLNALFRMILHTANNGFTTTLQTTTLTRQKRGTLLQVD